VLRHIGGRRKLPALAGRGCHLPGSGMSDDGAVADQSIIGPCNQYLSAIAPVVRRMV